ncbi:MAG: hypothetical protein R3C05_25540 [Pirellulaceae bacterium]
MRPRTRGTPAPPPAGAPTPHPDPAIEGLLGEGESIVGKVQVAGEPDAKANGGQAGPDAKPTLPRLSCPSVREPIRDNKSNRRLHSRRLF